MSINISHATGRVPVAIVGVSGDLDASSYQELIAKVDDLYRMGTRHVLVDLGKTGFVSSSGLVALHSIALLLRGEQRPDLEHGWAALHAIHGAPGTGPQQNVKLLNPQARVTRTLEMAGLSAFFEVHTDLDAAIASF